MTHNSITEHNFNTKQNLNWNWALKQINGSFCQFESHLKYLLMSMHDGNVLCVHMSCEILNEN